MKTICLDENFSTTKLLTKEKPIIENGLEDRFKSILFLSEGENRKSEGGLRTKGYFKKAYDHKPLVSIITVIFNGEKYLEQTIQSVINQTYDNVEYIIIDGGSTDGSVGAIKKYEEQIDYWISEEDDGIYDAMNKGMSLASGEWINFMNAGDVFYDEQVLNRIYMNPKLFQEIDFIYSDTLLDGKEILTCDIENNLIIHQSLIYRRRIHQEVGTYLVNKNLLISDYLFFMLCKHRNWYKSEVIISVYNTEGISNQNYKLHLNQAVGTDLMFNNIGRVKASAILLLYPFYKYLKSMLKKFLTL